MTLPNPIKPWSLWELTASWRRTKESTTLSKTANNGDCNKRQADPDIPDKLDRVELAMDWPIFRQLFAAQVVLATAGAAELVTSPP